MQITVGAKCWDGDRKKSLSNGIKVEGLPVVVMEESAVKKWKLDPKLKALIAFGVPIAFLASGLPPIGLGRAMASAITPGAAPTDLGEAVPAMSAAAGVHAKILHAFDPLVNLIQDLSYPIAAVMIAGGCLFVMVGNRERGMQMLQNAAIGYILVQMAPLLLSLLVGIGAGAY